MMPEIADHVADMNRRGRAVSDDELLAFSPGKSKYSHVSINDIADELGPRMSEIELAVAVEGGGAKELLLAARTVLGFGLDLKLAARRAKLSGDFGRRKPPGGIVAPGTLSLAGSPANSPGYIVPFAYAADQVAAIGALLGDMLKRRTATAPGALFVHDIPTGMGKSYTTALAQADAVEAAIRAYDAGQGGGTPQVMFFVAPLHSLIGDPMDDLRRELTRRRVSADKYRLVYLKGNAQILQDNLKASGPLATRRATDALPPGCLAFADLERSQDFRSAMSRFTAQQSQPGQDIVAAVTREISSVCGKAVAASVAADGCLPDACRGCLLRNSGHVAFGDGDAPPIRVIFLTYSKLFQGLPALLVEPKEDKKGGVRMVLTKTRYVATDKFAANTTPISGATFVFEECVSGFQVLWNAILESQCQIDVFILAEYLLTNVTVFDDAVTVMNRQVVAPLIAAKRLSPGCGATLLDALRDAVDAIKSNLEAKLPNEFYIRRADPRGGPPTDIKVYERFGQGVRRRTVSHASQDETNLTMLEVADMALSSLSKSDDVYYRVDAETTDQVTLALGTKDESGPGAQQAAKPFRMVPKNVIQTFMMSYLSLRSALSRVCRKAAVDGLPVSEDDVAAMWETLEGILKRRGDRQIRAAIDVFRMAASRNMCKDTDDQLTYLEIRERFRRTGYQMVHLEKNPAPRQYDVMVEAVPVTPDGIVDELLDNGNHVMLMSATGSLDNPTETFSVDYFRAFGRDIRQLAGTQRDAVAAAVAAKYAGRSDLEVAEIRPLLTKAKQDRLWRLGVGSGLSPLLVAFAAAHPDLLGFDGDIGRERKNPNDSILLLLDSVVADPGLPRLCMVVVNSVAEAEAICRLVDGFVGHLAAAGLPSGVPAPKIRCLSITSRHLKSDSWSDEEIDTARAEMVGFTQGFAADLLGDGLAPIYILVAPYATVGVGVNLQTRIPAAAIDGRNEMPGHLGRYVGQGRTLRIFSEGPWRMEIDLSDTVLALPRSKIVHDGASGQVGNRRRYLMTSEADQRLDLATTRNSLGCDIKALIQKLKRTDDYRTTIFASAVQAVGRGDRTLNNPARQRLWLHGEIMDMIAALPPQVYSGPEMPLLTRSQNQMVTACRQGRSTEWECTSSTSTDADGALGTIVSAWFNEGKYGPDAQEIAIELWELLKRIGSHHHAVTEAFFNSAVARQFDDLLEQLADLCDGDPLPSSLREFYMKVPVERIREWHEESDPVRRRDVNRPVDGKGPQRTNLVVRGVSAVHAGQDWFAALRGDLPAEVAAKAAEGRWLGYEFAVAASSAVPGGERVHLKSLLEQGKNGNVWLMRPMIMRDVGHPFVDEIRTESALRDMNADLQPFPPGFYEFADHLTAAPAVLWNNKAWRRGSLDGADGIDQMVAMVDDARQRIVALNLDRAKRGEPPVAAFAYVMRHPLRAEFAEQPIVGIAPGGYTTSRGRVDDDVFFVSLGDRNEESLQHLVHFLRTAKRKP